MTNPVTPNIDDEDGCSIDDGNDTLIILLESAIHLGREAMERLLKLLVAIVEGHPNHDDGVHDFMAAQHVLLLAAAWLAPNDRRLPSYIGNMTNNYQLGWGEDPKPGWLHRVLAGGQRYELLRDLTITIFGDDVTFRPVQSAMEKTDDA